MTGLGGGGCWLETVVVVMAAGTVVVTTNMDCMFGLYVWVNLKLGYLGSR